MMATSNWATRGGLGAFVAALGWIASGVVHYWLVFPTHGPGALGSLSATLIESFHALAEAATILPLLGLYALYRSNAGRLMKAGVYLAVFALTMLALVTVAVTVAGPAISEQVATPIFAAGLLGMFVGLPLVGVAAWRARVKPRWLAALLIAHPIFFLFLLESYSFGALALGLLWIVAGAALWSARYRPDYPRTATDLAG